MLPTAQPSPVVGRPIMARHTKGVPVRAATLEELLQPLARRTRSAPPSCSTSTACSRRSSQQPDDAHMPETTRRPLIEVAKRYGVVACVSGRRASDARRIVSLGSIAYLGSHGSEVLRPGSIAPEMDRELQAWTRRVQDFAREAYGEELRRLRVRLEDKEAIAALHWRGVPDEEDAEAAIERGRRGAPRRPASSTHWGRKVLEIRPPVRIDKGAGHRRRCCATRDLAAARLRRRRHHRPRRLPRPRRAAWSAGRLGARAARRRALGRDARRSSRRRPTSMVDGTDGVRDLLRALLAERARAVRRLPQGDGPAQRRRGDAAGRADGDRRSTRDVEPTPRLRRRRLVGGGGADRRRGSGAAREADAADRAAAGRARARRRTLPELRPGADARSTACGRCCSSTLGAGVLGVLRCRRSAGDRGRLRDHLGARLAAPGGGGGGDRGARRRALLRRPHVAAAADPAASARRASAATFLARSRDRAADVLLVSLGGTAGLREADAELAASLRRAGASVAVARAARGRASGARIALIELAWARAARRGRGARRSTEHRPRAVLYSTTTAALLAPRAGRDPLRRPGRRQPPGPPRDLAAPGRAAAAARPRRCSCRGARAGWPRRRAPHADAVVVPVPRRALRARRRTARHRRGHLRRRTRRRRASTACSPRGRAARRAGRGAGRGRPRRRRGEGRATGVRFAGHALARASTARSCAARGCS